VSQFRKIRFTATLFLTFAVAGCNVHWRPSDQSSDQGKGGDPSPEQVTPITKAAAAAPDGYRESRRQSALDTIAHLDEFKGWADARDYFQKVSGPLREKLADEPWEDALNEFWDVDKADWDKEKARQGLQELADGWADPKQSRPKGN
jgi:hypothetical protein